MFVCESWVQIVLKSVYQSIPKTLIQPCNCPEALYKARFKCRATAVPNSIDRIKFDFSTAVARRLKPSRAFVVLQSSYSRASLARQ